MNVNTKYFGIIDYTKDELIHFPEGLFGFEHLKDYLPIAFSSDDDSLISLQSIADEQVAFIIINPFRFYTEYNPSIDQTDLSSIGSPIEDDISYYVICVIRGELNQSTVNLKCPIVINSLNRYGKQVILDSPEYTFRHLLKVNSKAEE